jgi:hypothetical protein
MKLDVGDPGYEEMRQELGLPPGTLIVLASPRRGTWSYCPEFPPTEYATGPDGKRISAALARWLASPWAPNL